LYSASFVSASFTNVLCKKERYEGTGDVIGGRRLGNAAEWPARRIQWLVIPGRALSNQSTGKTYQAKRVRMVVCLEP
jgi:hypothetical protein